MIIDRKMSKRMNIWFGGIMAAVMMLAGCGGGETGVSVLQWNVWQEGTKVPGGYGAIVEEIARLRPDFVTLSEVRNYGGVDFTARLVDSLRARGVTYYSFRSYDSGILSRHPLVDTATVFPERDDHGSVYKAVVMVDGRRVAVYTAHLDWQDCCYYNTRGLDGRTWKACDVPTDAGELLAMSDASLRDDAIRLFVEDARRETEAGAAVVLGGDFNEPSHRDWVEENRDMYDHAGLVVKWTVTRLLEEAGFRDAYREVWPDPLACPGFTYPAWIDGVDPLRVTWTPRADERERIDYVFVGGGGVSVARAAVFGPKASIVRGKRVEESSSDEFVEPQGVWPSDHKGVWVELRLGKNV